MNQPQTKASVDTREKILDAAEQLFVERGYAATSMRAIAERASVNLAATNYHFGSKQGLMAEVFHRRLGPINKQRLLNLDRLESAEEPPTVRDILMAFLEPFLDDERVARAPGIIGWIYGEPDAVTRPMLLQEFSMVATRFQMAFAAVLPGVDHTVLQWRFHFLVGSMLHLLRQHAPLGEDPSKQSFEEGMEQLINYSVAAWEQDFREAADA